MIELKSVLQDDFWIMPATPKYEINGIPYITSKNIKNGKIDFQNANYISVDDYYKISKKRPIKENDILISMIGTLGETAIVTNEDGIFYGQNMFLVRLNQKKIYNQYFMYYFKSNFVKRQLHTKQNKSTQSYLKAGHIESLKINLPSYKTQKEVVKKLDKIVCILNKYKIQIDMLDELVKARFVELFGTLDNPTFNYNKSTLGELCYKITDGKHGGCSLIQGSNRYFVGAREIYDDKVHYENAPEISVDDFEKDYRRCNVEVGDFLIVNTGATIGKSAIATDKRTKHTLLQKSVALLKLNQDLLNPEFLKWCYRINTRMYLVESSSAQPNLLLSKIKATEIYVPPIELQNQFADFVKEVDKSRFIIKSTIKEGLL